MIIGRTTVTSGAFSLIFSNNIEVAFLTGKGRYVSRLIYSEKKNTLLRHRQHLVSADERVSLSIAKDIVRGKLHNQYLFMQRIGRKTGDKEGRIASAINEMSHIRKMLENASDISEVRGLEGDGSRLYFSCLGKNINCGWIEFHNRTKNPPLDPVNSVLSFLYTVLANRISGHIHRSGLDPGIGTLHSVTYGRESLVYDLIEEFRTPIVDTLTCSLFNMLVLKKEHFRVEPARTFDDEDGVRVQLTGEGPDAVLLNEEGCRRVLEQFERKLSETHHHPFTDSILSYDKIIQEQVKIYKNVIAGTLDHYLPLVVT